MKAAPHIRPDGTITRPVPESLLEAIARATAPRPRPQSNDDWDRFIEGLRRCPQRRADLAEVLADELAQQQGGQL